MKRGFNILMILCVVGFVFSCDNNKTYTEYLKDERKAINRLMDENGFKKLKEFPEDGVFKENEFVELSNGVYLNIIDSGNGQRPTSSTTILCRAKGKFLSEIVADSGYFDGFKSYDSAWPLEFKYGTSADAKGDAYYMSGGLGSALDFVGDSSFVKLIVPFRVGSSMQSNYYIALYFERVRFTFQK